MLRGFTALVLANLASAMMAAGGVPAAAVLQAAQAPQKLQASETSQASRAASQSSGQTSGQTSSSTQGGQSATTSHGWHFVSVTFDYDFAKTPACSATVKTACVEGFVAYDISAGVKHRTKLFNIPLPSKPVGLVHGITGKSPTKLDFESGKHLISVSAREPGGKESKHRACTTWIDIP
ncbi:MAG: hypothetical protein WA434_00385 [Candidatus Acidiferrales bacterium]